MGIKETLSSVYLRSLASVEQEVDETLQVAEGRLPAELKGVLFRNGPGTREVFGDPYTHPFDGDGMITRFEFTGEKVHYRNRFVKTKELAAEKAAGRMLYRGFGTNIPGGWWRNAFRLRFKNAANTSVVYHGKRLLALWEGGLPHELHPETLNTVSRFDFGGGLQNHHSRVDRFLNPELPFSAHPRLDRRTGDLFNFGCCMGAKPRLMLYRIGSDGTFHPPESIPLKELTFVHDFTLTEHYRVFFLAPVAFRIFRMLLGMFTPAESLTGTVGAPTKILVVAKNSTESQTFEASPGFIFHYVNAFEEGKTLVVDALRVDEFPAAAETEKLLGGKEFKPYSPRLTRYRVSLDSGKVEQDGLAPELAVEFPSIDPRKLGIKHRFIWMAATLPDAGPFHTGIVKFDTQSKTYLRSDFSPNLMGEPVFVPRGNEEDAGWLVAPIYLAEHHLNELLVLDAKDLSTVCRLRLPHHFPLGFHGTWVSASDA